jgi:hypothetical protein
VTTLPLPDRPPAPGALSPAPLSFGSAGSGLAAVPDLPLDAHAAVYPTLGGQGDFSAVPPLALTDVAEVVAVTRIAATVELLVGLWLALSPWVIGSNGSGPLRWSNVVVGVLLMGLGLVRVVRPVTRQGPALSFALGAWTIVAAFVLSFQNGATGTAPLWNAIACGAVLTAAAAWATTEAERAGLRHY